MQKWDGTAWIEVDDKDEGGVARIASLERQLAAYRAAWGTVRALAKYWMDQPIDEPRVDDIANRHGIDEKEKK